MPYDAANNVLYGLDARRPRAYALSTALAFLRDRLNDADGPYYEELNLTGDRPVVATDNMVVAAALYDQSGADLPIVYGYVGASTSQLTGKKIGGTDYEGKRHSITLRFDSGVNDSASDENESPVAKLGADRTLADFVIDALEEGLEELTAVGLQNVDVKPDEQAQLAGRGRNPVVMTCFVMAIKGYDGS